jgi:hypothetical protein
LATEAVTFIRLRPLRVSAGSEGEGQACLGVRAWMEREKKFNARIERIVAEICQQKT